MTRWLKLSYIQCVPTSSFYAFKVRKCNVLKVSTHLQGTLLLCHEEKLRCWTWLPHLTLPMAVQTIFHRRKACPVASMRAHKHWQNQEPKWTIPRLLPVTTQIFFYMWPMASLGHYIILTVSNKGESLNEHCLLVQLGCRTTAGSERQFNVPCSNKGQCYRGGQVNPRPTYFLVAGLLCEV